MDGDAEEDNEFLEEDYYSCLNVPKEVRVTYRTQNAIESNLKISLLRRAKRK